MIDANRYIHLSTIKEELPLAVMETAPDEITAINRVLSGALPEFVYPVGLPEGYVMVVDDMGFPKGLPYNPLASALYGLVSGGEIVGPALILKLTEDGDSSLLTGDEADTLMSGFREILDF